MNTNQIFDERSARMALSFVVEPATPKICSAVAEFGAEMVWRKLVDIGGPLAKKASILDLASMAKQACAQHIRFIIPGDEEWVDRLVELGRAEQLNSLGGVPFGLWLKGAGHLAKLCANAVSIVGSRAATAYGERIAHDFGFDLGEAQRSVVSGGAYGIDAAAHRGCLESRSPTIAVMAGGLDTAYPPGNESLFDRITEKGVLVSEFPPGEHPTRMRFLGRNRLIAALTEGTVMVEAQQRSGAKNTMNWANILNRITMAVPGPVTNANSYGPHQLIREGQGVLVTNGAEVCELLGPLGKSSKKQTLEHRPTDMLDPVMLCLYESLPTRAARSAEELALRAELSLGQCLGLLNQLADLGLIWQNPKREWQLTTAKQRKQFDSAEGL